MSRIGRKIIPIPNGVNVKIDELNVVTVKGPRGVLQNEKITKALELVIDEGNLTVKRFSDDKKTKSLHGTTRSIIFNMVIGVNEGFKKELEIIGVGYRAQKKGNDLVLALGYSHPVILNAPEGIEIQVPSPNRIIVIGNDKQVVGQFAAIIRSKRPPEPYKGKGIRYAGEKVRRKLGKSGSKKS